MEFYLHNWAKTLLYPGILVLFVTYIASQAGVSLGQSNALIPVAMIMGASVVLFAMPSSYAHAGVRDNDVMFLAELIVSQTSCESELRSIHANLEILEEGAKDRVKALSWALGTAWAVALLGYNQFMGIFTRVAEKNQIGELLSGSLSFLIVVGVLALFSLFAITGYRRATAMVFRGLQFACNQASIRLCAQPHEDGAG